MLKDSSIGLSSSRLNAVIGPPVQLFVFSPIILINRGRIKSHIMQSEALEQMFLNKKPVDLLIELDRQEKRNYASALSKDADVTYSHTVKCLQKMEKHGLVEFERKGRKKEINLTDQGDEIAGNLFDLVRNMTGEADNKSSVIEDSSLN